jgi:hypothetical protein
MKITVTQEDIDTGWHSDCSNCPIARAAKRVPELGACAVSPTTIRSHLTGQMYYLPEEAQRFVNRFDLGLKVGPFEFDLGESIVVKPNRDPAMRVPL